MSERTDAELVAAAREGDVGSFGELYRRHYAAAVGIAYCAVSDHHLAEDAAQEGFAIACRDLHRLRDGDRFAGWLGVICRRVAKRVAKSERRVRLSADVHAATAADGNGRDERVEMVQAAVRRLPRSAQEVIVLHYFSGLSHEQTGATLGISSQAVHGRLIRARQKLAKDLRRTGLGRRKP